MATAMDLRIKFIELGKHFTEKEFDDLKYALIEESGKREEIQNFNELIEVLKQREPDKYIEVLVDAVTKLKLGHLLKKLHKLGLTCDQPEEDGVSKTPGDRSRSRLSFTRQSRGRDVRSTHKDDCNELQTDGGSLPQTECVPLQEPRSFGLRKYQLELAKPALEGKNYIMCAPTGSGKTVAVGHICRELIAKNPGIKIIFLVTIRSLAKQQAELLGNMLNITVLSNSDLPLSLVLKKNNIVVATHQIFLNELETKVTKLQSIDLIIVDECHHARLNHPYSQIMNHYHLDRKCGQNLPQILGLTASLGTDGSTDADGIVEHFVQLCARLDGTINFVRHNVEELVEHNPKPTEDQIIACDRRDGSLLQSELMELMSEIDDKYDIGIKQGFGSTQYLNGIIVKMKEYERQENTCDEILVCKILQIINDALLFFNDSVEDSVLDFLENKMDALNSGTGDIAELKLMIATRTDTLRDKCHRKDAWKSNRKLVELCKLLERLSTRNSTCIIITQTCRNVDFLYNFLTDHEILKDKLHCIQMVGQGNEEFGMTEAQQLQAISGFRHASGCKCSVMVATDVAQEGVDYPKCDSVIRYNFVSNEIGTVQSRGRARAQNSKIFLIVDKDSVDLRREFENLARENKMQEVLQRLFDEGTRFEERLAREKINFLQRLQIQVQKEDENKSVDPKNVHFYCKTCKALLCNAAEVKNTQAGYICTNLKIESKISFSAWSSPREHKMDSQLGDIYCVGCDLKLGMKVSSKTQSREPIGYVLKKDTLAWKQTRDVDYNLMPKKWDQLPFWIEKCKF